MSHLSMETLVALRDPGTEPGETAARGHLEACPLCRAEFERLHQRVARLKALPALRPSRERWPRVLGEVRAARRNRFRTGGLAGLAAAASVALALGVSSLGPAATGMNPADIQEAAPTAGLHVTTSAGVSKDWSAARLVSRKNK